MRDSDPLVGVPDRIADVLAQVGDTSRAAALSGWHRMGRAVRRGLLTFSAADAMERERALVARVRARRSAPWLTAFVAGKGGVGTTTTAAAVSLALASLRHDVTTLVDPRHGTGSLGQRLTGQPAPTMAQLTESGPARPPIDPLRVRGALAVVDGAPWDSPVSAAQLAAALDRLRDESGFTVVDVGNDISGPADAVLARADQLVVVTTAAQDAIEPTRAALLRVRHVAPILLGTVTVAIVCLTSGRYRLTARRLRAALDLSADRALVVPFDPALAAGGLLEPAQLRPASREAFMRLAGFVANPGRPDRDLPATEPVIRRTRPVESPAVGRARPVAPPAVGRTPQVPRYVPPPPPSPSGVPTPGAAR